MAAAGVGPIKIFAFGDGHDMPLKANWKNAKTKWEKACLPKLEAPVLEKMKKAGWDKSNFGKKLDTFDSAKTLTDKRSAWALAAPVADTYVTLLGKAKSDTKVSAVGSGMAELSKSIDSIIKLGKAGIQDPKPSGRAETLRLVAVQNAAGGLRPKWLEVGAIDIKAWLVVDATVIQMEKDKEIGFQWSELQKACAEEVRKTVDAFSKTILVLDAKLKILSEKDRQAKVKEANEVLKHYKGIVEANVNRIVDDYWARALKRQAYLREFKKECKIDIAMSGVAIAVSTVSIAMSFGAAAVSVAVIAKAVLDIALTLDKLNRSANEVEQSLMANMVKLNKLYDERLEAKEKNAGQKASKAAQAGKTAIASALGPVSALMMTTTPRTLKEAKEYVGKLSETETKAGQMYKELSQLASQLGSSPVVGPDPVLNRTMAAIYNNFTDMFRRYQILARQLRVDIAWGERCIATCEKLSDMDAIVTFTNKAGTTAKLTVALASLAKVTYQLATALG